MILMGVALAIGQGDFPQRDSQRHAVFERHSILQHAGKADVVRRLGLDLFCLGAQGGSLEAAKAMAGHQHPVDPLDFFQGVKPISTRYAHQKGGQSQIGIGAGKRSWVGAKKALQKADQAA